MYAPAAAESVGYTGTVTAPATGVARSASSHSGRLSDTIATRSPDATPNADSPSERSLSCSNQSRVEAPSIVVPTARPTSSGFG